MKKLILVAALFFAATSLSSAAEWKIVPEQSMLQFKAMQNTTMISGSFKKFTGKINFDPAQLASSKVEIEVDLNSVETSLADGAATLKNLEWFSVKAFPKATFTSNKFAKIGDKRFTASGLLTIKGISIPAKLEFTLDEYSASKAKAVGFVGIKRSSFNVGAKDPANAHGVQDEVGIVFAISAMK